MKIIPTLAILCMLGLSQIEAKNLPQITQVLRCDQLPPDLIEGFAQGMYPNLAIEFQEGAAIPLQFLFNYKIFSLYCNPNLSAKVDATCYLRCVKNKIYVSLDMNTWEKASEFFRGSLVPSVERSKDNSTVLIKTDLVEY